MYVLDNGSVPISKTNIKKLSTAYEQARDKIFDAIKSADNFTSQRRRQILQQITSILGTLADEYEKIASGEITRQYQVGAKTAYQDMERQNVEIKTPYQFAQIDKQAVQVIIDDTRMHFLEAMNGVYRSSVDIVSTTAKKLITEKLSTGLIKGEALKTVKREVIGILEERGIEALKDRAGKAWTLDRYSEMLVRTKYVDARNTGLANQILKNGYDLVQVSYHPGSCTLCDPWQNKILSISGKTEGYPTLEQARKEGLFHPNCRHAINLLSPELMKETKAYDTKTKTYKKAS